MSRRGYNLKSPLSAEDRFWSKVRKVGRCWEWQDRPNQSGYGKFVETNTVRELAHRRMYRLMCGSIPDGLQVLHTCDNRRCVNPVHLFLGTNADNVVDKVNKGRQSRLGGELNPNAKLSVADVGEIKRLRANGIGRREVATKFGVSTTMVSLITTGRYWQGVTG